MLEVNATDGSIHRAAIYGTGPVVVLAHQSSQDLCSLVVNARWLQTSGYTAVAVDLPGNDWDLTLAAVVAAMRARGASSIQLLGGSKGGCASMVAAAAIEPPVDSVVNLSGERKLKGLDADAAVARSRVPLLIVGSAEDGYLDEQNARALFDESAASDKKLVLMPGTAHGFAILDGPNGSKVRQSVLEFLRAHA